MRARPAWAIVVFLLGAAGLELVLARTRTIAPHGEGVVVIAALVAMLVGMALTLSAARGPVALVAPAAAVFVTARFYTGDPYYRPTYRTYSDGGLVSPSWMLVLLVLSLAAGVTVWRWRHTPAVEGTVLLFFLAGTTVFMGAGH